MAKKPLTQTGSGLIVITILLIVLSIVSMIFDAQGKIPEVRSTIQTYISIPIKSASSWPEGIKKNISFFFVERSKLIEENERLRKQVVWLKSNLANQTVVEADNRRLKSLFESTALRARPVMIAEVLDSQIDNNKHQIEINKGSIVDVYEGQVAIDENGVVGQVTSVSENASTISLITDERQMIPVFVERNRLRMIARGTGNLSELEMEYVHKKSDVRVGDKLVTSGLGNRYPRGYTIGIVTEVNSSLANEFMQIKARPLASLDKILEVLLIQPVQATYLEDKKNKPTRTSGIELESLNKQ